MPLEYPSFELSTYGRISDIEQIMHQKIAPSAKETRSRGLEEEWIDLREALVECLIQDLPTAEYMNKGKRYTAFKVDGLLMKFLHTRRARNIWLNGGFLRKSNSQDNIFQSQKEEHGIVKTYFGDMVPDTMFFHRPFPIEELPQIPELQTVNHEKPHFIVQERVINGLSILEASRDTRAETQTFKESLVEFSKRYDFMRKEIGMIPEVQALGGNNVLVGTDGNVWVIDTNHLVRTTQKKTGEVTRRYGKQYGVKNITEPDNIIRGIEKLVKELEKGHVPENPQG